MGKRSSSEMFKAEESGGAPYLIRWQEAVNALDEGAFDRVTEFLGKIDKEKLRIDQSYLIDVTIQVCLACTRSKNDATWHHQAQQEEEQRLAVFQQQLRNMLDLFGEPGFFQGQTIPEQIPVTYSVPMQPKETQAPESQRLRGLWRRFRAFLEGAIPLPAAEEKILPLAGTPEPPAQEIIPPGPAIVEPARAIPPGEGASEQVSPSMVVYCLGSFHLYQGDQEITDWHSLKGRDIFKYLLLHRETPVARDILIDVFWRDMDPKAARRNLHQTIYSLRQTLRGEQTEFNHIWFKNDCYSLNPQLEIWLDFIEFEKHIQAGSHLEKAGHIKEAIEQYGIAEGLYQGDFLAEALYEDWPALQREKLSNEYMDVVDRLCNLYYQIHQYAAVIPLCQKVLLKDRCYEPAHRRLMQCYLTGGQRHLAVRQFQACTQALKEELDISPTEETMALYHQIMTQSRE